MTNHETVYDPAADDWFDRRQQDLLDSLDSVLDIEAGLREVLLQSRNDTMTDGLDSVLDVEAGLAAILPRKAEPEAQPAQDVQELTSVEALLAAVSPPVRIALRRHPEVLRGAEARERIPELYRLKHAMVETTRRLQDSVVAGHIFLELALDTSLRFSGLARNLYEQLGAAGGFLNPRLDDEARRSLAEVLDFAGDLASVIDRASILTREVEYFSRARGSRGHQRPGRNNSRQQVQGELRQALSQVRDHAASLDRLMMSVFYTIEGFTLECLAKLQRILAREVGRRGFPRLALDDLHLFLDDFTTADLRDAALADVDLTGVHWSVHQTRWPEAVDVECLKAISTEVAPGSGIYVVRSGTATIREFAELV
ncbi:hypothetical protein [Streptomyces violascens]|uniref:Uncharacterized protein n=1 Tax=Streptomyces violascens TaxID=67381 RepID=A0ABQ3QL44_9ACTN|nr:hypothetical protein [Streptomyces violascens]GGU44407.1 hypothetical protein GCM10010289_76220 [Streptomyces violascens]GHI37993.1 hypothetical protein Sviol_24010 [Streptomyces violascens]